MEGVPQIIKKLVSVRIGQCWSTQTPELLTLPKVLLCFKTSLASSVWYCVLPCYLLYCPSLFHSRMMVTVPIIPEDPKILLSKWHILDIVFYICMFVYNIFYILWYAWCAGSKPTLTRKVYSQGNLRESCRRSSTRHYAMNLIYLSQVGWEHSKNSVCVFSI